MSTDKIKNYLKSFYKTRGYLFVFWLAFFLLWFSSFKDPQNHLFELAVYPVVITGILEIFFTYTRNKTQ